MSHEKYIARKRKWNGLRARRKKTNNKKMRSRGFLFVYLEGFEGCLEMRDFGFWNMQSG